MVKRSLFVYGSLMFAPVWERVTGLHDADSALPATLADYRRHAVRGETYPALVASAGSTVSGRLHIDVSEAVITRLDRFEGEDYRRIEVMVKRADDGTFVTAHTYLYLVSERVEPEPWNVNAFEQAGMQRFLHEYCGFDMPG